jgi:Fe-S-cluster containining protein
MEKLVFDPEGLRQQASGEKKQNKQLFKTLRKIKPSVLDNRINALHDHYMGNMDCLECGNCCKSISPAVHDKDIERIAKYLKKKPSEVVSTYFNMDEDGDYIFPVQPCPFLGSDNYCSIYTARPKACREYPHTDRSKQHQILNITANNIAVCPVVHQIVTELRDEFS